MSPIEQIDYEGDRGTVRLLCTDINEDDPLFTDAQVDAFLRLEGGNVKRAAARALDVIAVSEVLVSKKIRTQDLQTDGPAVAKSLHEQALALRADADRDDDADQAFFDIVPGPGRGCGVPELTEHPISAWWC